jgi:hypothetical protein
MILLRILLKRECPSIDAFHLNHYKALVERLERQPVYVE